MNACDKWTGAVWAVHTLLGRDLASELDHWVAVGDSGNDVACARAAGAPVVVVPYGYREGRAVQDLAADAIVDSLDDLPERVAVRRTPDSR